MAQPDPPTRFTRPTPLWRHVSFTLMWTSTAASGFGDRMIMLAALALLGGLVEGIDNSTSIQASTQFWFFIPYLLFSVPAGWVADHLPRKWLLLTCDELRGLVLLLAFLLVAQATGPADIPAAHHYKVLAVLFVIGTFAAFFNPTRNAIVPQLIPSSQLQAGNAVILGITVIASLIGMVVGSHFIIDRDSAASVRSGLLIASLFYLISGTFFAFMRVHRKLATNGPPSDRSLRAAIRYVAKHQRIIVLIIVNILIWSSAAVVSTALLGLGKMQYGLQGNELNRFFGVMSAILGAGMLLGAFAIGAIRTRRESTAVMLLALASAGLCILLLASVPVRALAFLFAFGIGFFGNITIVAAMTILQSISPNYIRGRVMGLNSLGSTIFSVITYFAIWRLPNADANILYVLYLLGPVLIIVGTVALRRHLVRGPQFTKPLNVLWRGTRLFVLIWHRLQWSGRDHIPRTGPVILAANHTTGLDPLLMQGACPRLIRWLMLTSYQFPAANFVWREIKPITLDRESSDLAKIRTVVQVLKDGQVVGLFPEGGLQRTQRSLQPLEPGIAMIAKRSGAAIVPVWISGTPMRQSMLWQFFQPSHSRVIFGKPFTPDPHASHEQVMEHLRQRMLELQQIAEQ
jgi:1-acyl-sn-glycerol-3-phosphate acyltransferase